MKSSLTVFAAKKSARLSSGAPLSRSKPRIPTATPLKRPLLHQASVQVMTTTPRKSSRPAKCSRKSASRLRDHELVAAHSKTKTGPSSLYYLKERSAARKDSRSISFLGSVNLEATNKEIYKSPRCLDNEYGFQGGSPLRVSLSPDNSDRKGCY
jgi:hypothetical protein